jgi:carbonic anhydrase
MVDRLVPVKDLISRKEKSIDGLVNIAGWERQLAEEHFLNFSQIVEIANGIDFVLGESKRLRVKCPRDQVAPLFYSIDNNLLYLINEN